MKYFITFVLLLFISSPLIQSQNRILISKKDFRLWVINQKRDTLFTTPISCGLNYGDKQRIGDKRTPEGCFKIYQIQDASSWGHDFHDGKGYIPRAFGPYFLRLAIPGNNTIGIHGTCFPESMGTRATEGCIRLENSEMEKLMKYVTIGTMCTILPDPM